MFTRQARKARREARSGTRYEVNEEEIERIMALMGVIKRGRERQPGLRADLDFRLMHPSSPPEKPLKNPSFL